jgi:hypothetical protein
MSPAEPAAHGSRAAQSENEDTRRTVALGEARLDGFTVTW